MPSCPSSSASPSHSHDATATTGGRSGGCRTGSRCGGRGCGNSSTWPVINLASESQAELVGHVKSAAETVGFFHVMNHGLSADLLADMLACVGRFHESPADAKAPYYTRDLGRCVRYQSNFDLFQLPTANWRDTLYMDIPAAATEEMPAVCRHVVAEYAKLVREPYRALLELLSEALGLEKWYLKQDVACLDRLNFAGHFYPPCPKPHLTLDLDGCSMRACVHDMSSCGKG